MNSRFVVVKILSQVLLDGRNLPDAIANNTDKLTKTDSATDLSQQRAFIQAMSYGVIRLYPRLQFITDQLISKPLKIKDQDVYLLIITGLYQIIEMRIPDHAAVSETVKVTKNLKKPWAKNLVNAVLRNYQRQHESIDSKIAANDVAKFAHPGWWIKLIKKSWPSHWQQILESNNQNPPMTLRLNTSHIPRQEYLELLAQQQIQARPGLHSENAIYLQQPVQVSQLPLFHDGWVSVQDEAAQLAALILDPQKGEHILDACAAPGGKTVHLLEREKDISLLALDIDASRLEKVRQNLERTHLNAELLAANAFTPDNWWDKQPFDRILLDAPCSASGVIRRHPDIKILRKRTDISTLVKQQEQILNALWPLLKTGGMLLYATCSIFPEENDQQVQRFLQQNTNAELSPLLNEFDLKTSQDTLKEQTTGTQILPGEDGMDGFFYARIYKK